MKTITLQIPIQDEENPTQYFDAEKQYPLFTPLNQEHAASQLQELLKQHKS